MQATVAWINDPIHHVLWEPKKNTRQKAPGWALPCWTLIG